jgi:hypothetical protein
VAISLEFINDAVVLVTLLIGGEIAIRAFLKLATFSHRDISLQSRQWRLTSIKAALIYLLLGSGFLGKLFEWWQSLFAKMSDLPIELMLAVMMLTMLVPVSGIVGFYMLFPVSFWMSGLAASNKTDRIEGRVGMVWNWKKSVEWKWKERRGLILGTFGAFVCLLLALALPSIKAHDPIILFLLAAVFSVEQVGPGLFMEPTHKWFRRWTIPVAFLYYWGTACIGWQYDWLGLPFITLPALLITTGSLFLASGFLLHLPTLDLYRGERPPRTVGSLPSFREELSDFIDLFRYSENKGVRREWFEQRRKTLRCLLAYALGTNYPYYVVIDEKINERTEGNRTWLTGKDKLVKRLDGDSFAGFLAGPGIILTGCDHAVAISAGTRFKGIRGPGVILTDGYENPSHVIDLRVHLRAFEAEAWTKDGIAVKVTTFIPFQISRGDRKPELGKEFPYRASDVFRALHVEPMKHVDLSQVPENMEKLIWYDMPQLIGEPIMRDIISNYEFDELYAPFELYDDFSQHPRARIAEELRTRLDANLPKLGIKRVGGGISNILPVDERVIEQRIEAWRADWIRKVTLKRSAGQSTRIRIVEEARTQAQVKIILAMAERIERLRDAETPDYVDAVLQYFIEVLEQLADRPKLREILPRDVGSILLQLRGVVDGEFTDEPGREE